MRIFKPIGLMSSSLSEWTGESRLSRRISQILTTSRDVNLMPPPPPPPVMERSTITLNTTEIISAEENSSSTLPTTNDNVESNETQTSTPAIRIGDHRNGSLFNLNLNRNTTTSTDPFVPTFTLNRTPRRNNTTNANTNQNTFNMRMFNR